MIPAKVRIFLLIFGLALFSELDAQGSDWRPYGTMDGKGAYFYDRESITFLPEGEVRVWQRLIREEELRKAFEEKKEATQKFIERKVLGKQALTKEQSEILYQQWQREFLQNLVIAEKRMLIEMKCEEKIFRVVSGLEFDGEGNLKKGFVASQIDWLPIDPGTPIEGLYRAICPKSR